MADARIAPACRHFPTCGGCTWLDRPIDAQLGDKVARAAAALAPWLGGVTIAAAQPGQAPRWFRQKLLYPVQPDRDSGLRTGLYARGTHELVDIDDCQVQNPALTELARRATAVFRELRLVPYDERSGRGELRAFQARVMPGTGELLLGFVTTRPADATLDGVAGALADAARGLRDPHGRTLDAVGVVHNHHPRPGNALLGPVSTALRGRAFQRDRVGALTLRVGFASFYQVHEQADALLYAPALRLLGDVRGLQVIDGYGGVGAFGVRLAAAGAARVDSFESHPGACADARANAADNALPAMHVNEGDFAAAELPPDAGACVVDPPRKGLGAAGVATLLRARPRRVLYVACALRALARDLEPLCACGYRVTALELADLFPHTEHGEWLCRLDREA